TKRKRRETSSRKRNPPSSGPRGSRSPARTTRSTAWRCPATGAWPPAGAAGPTSRARCGWSARRRGAAGGCSPGSAAGRGGATPPDGQSLAWAGWDRRIRVRALATGKERFHFSVNANARVAFSPDGKFLASASEGKQVLLLEAKTGKLVGDLKGDLLDFYCVGFSRDSRLLAAGGGAFNRQGPGHVVVWDVPTRKQIAKLQGHQRGVIGLAFAPPCPRLATAGVDSTVRLWDPQSFKEVRVLQGHTGTVKGLAFTPDGKTLASGSFDGTLRLWDVQTGRNLSVLQGHPAA